MYFTECTYALYYMYAMYIVVLVKDYPVAMRFNHDTKLGLTIMYITWFVEIILSCFQVLKCVEEIRLVQTRQWHSIAQGIGMYLKQLHPSIFPKHSAKLTCSHTSVSDLSSSLSSST